MISSESIKKHIKNEALCVKVYDLIDSTNAEAKRYAAEADLEKFSPVLFVAREQSAGRGRMGRQFLSRSDCGLYMSLLYFTSGELCGAVKVTTTAASVVALAIERVTGKRMRIKWVNDIYNESGKVCGILAETLPVRGGYAIVVGIGINIGDNPFPEELKNIASSVGDLNGEESRLIALIADGLLSYAENGEDRSYLDAYRERFMFTGEMVDLFRADEKILSGRVIGVDDDGGLLLLPEGETEVVAVRSGEISLRRK